MVVIQNLEAEVDSAILARVVDLNNGVVVQAHLDIPGSGNAYGLQHLALPVRPSAIHHEPHGQQSQHLSSPPVDTQGRTNRRPSYWSITLH